MSPVLTAAALTSRHQREFMQLPALHLQTWIEFGCQIWRSKQSKVFESLNMFSRKMCPDWYTSYVASLNLKLRDVMDLMDINSNLLSLGHSKPFQFPHTLSKRTAPVGTKLVIASVFGAWVAVTSETTDTAFSVKKASICSQQHPFLQSKFWITECLMSRPRKDLKSVGIHWNNTKKKYLKVTSGLKPGLSFATGGIFGGIGTEGLSC